MLYSAIIKQRRIISDYSEEEGDFNLMILKLCDMNQTQSSFIKVSHLSYDFFYLRDGLYTYGSIAYCNNHQTDAYEFLLDIKDCFSKVMNSQSKALTYDSTSLLKEAMRKYHIKNYQRKNKYDELEETLTGLMNEKIGIMTESLEKDKLLNRLDDKSKDLDIESNKMHRSIIKKRIQKTKGRAYLIGIFILILILALCFIMYYFSKSFNDSYMHLYLNKIPIVKKNH